MRNTKDLDLMGTHIDGNAVRERLLDLMLAADRRRQQAGGITGARSGWTGPIPLSHAQERLWFLDQLGLVGAAYNMPLAFRLQGDLDVPALNRSFASLVHRHESLRTRFGVQDGLPYQVIDPPGPFDLHRADLSYVADHDERERHLREYMRHEQFHRFELREDPPLRVILVKLAAREHALLLTMHHIASDGWSLGVLMRELSALYAAYARGQPNSLPELPIQYADYAIWQRQWLQGDALESQLQYWSEQLADASPHMELPTDRPRPAVESFKGASLKFELSAALSRALKELGQEEGATLFMVILAAYQLALSRWSGQEDIVVGSPIAGRRNREIEGLIGFFVNTLVLRTHISSDLTFRQLLQRVRELTLGAYAHQDLPFESLVKGLRPERNLARQPVFQVMLAHQNFPEERLELPGVTWTRIDAEFVTTHFDLTLHVYEVPSGLLAVFQYATDLFDPATVARMAGHVRTLLEGIAANPDCPIHRLPLLTKDEELQLLQVWNATDVPYAREKLIHELFEEQVRRTPNAVAVTYQDRSLTYAEFNRRANQLARYLTATGVRPDRLVALCVERSIEMLLGVFGVLKAGGAYVPLDPTNPVERLEQMLTDARPDVLLTQEALRNALPQTGSKVVLLDRDWKEIARHSDENLDPRSLKLTSQHLAYVIFTSGSTGKPKGVMVEHRNVVNYAVHALRQFDVASGSGSLICTSISFDLVLTGLYPPLLCGRTVRLCAEEHGLPALAETLPHCDNLTPLKLTPSHLVLLEDALRRGQLAGRVRALVLGGEPLHASAVQLWQKYAPGTLIFNHYGPTETTVGCIVNEIAGDVSGTVAIGRPIANTQVYILDRHLQPVPIGVTGEIYVGGAGVARGYLNQPELTAERFIQNPFVATSARLYKTGDAGRWRADGTIEFKGRNDHQVKIRGYRIELGEIEAQLVTHAQVKEAAVVVREDSSGEKRVVGYVVGDRNAAPEAAENPENLRQEIVSEWETVHEETYQTNPATGPSFIGWDSSYTGQPIPETEMQEWVSCTIERIRALHPKKVLEIGCGVGLLLQHLAPQCDRYVGVDFSVSALDQLDQWMTKRDDLRHVELLHRSATDLHGLEADSFDTVILNSVVQYFPDIDYLIRVLESAVRLLDRGGKIFIGDVRHLGLLSTFHSAVQLAKAAATVTVGQLRKRIARAVAQEKELVIDPQFFRALRGRVPDIGLVDVQLKRGRAPNELTRYRYDVVLHKGGEPRGDIVCTSIEWHTAVRSRVELETALREHRWDAALLRSIPNERLAIEVAARELIETSDEQLEASALRLQLNELQSDTVDPDELWVLGRAYDYDVTVSWDPQDTCGCFEVQLLDCARSNQVQRARRHVERPAKPWAAYATNPLENGFKQHLIAQLREYLKRRLPEYMIPSSWMVLNQLPLTANGKLDRRALPVPQTRGEEIGEYVPPQTDLEHTLADIWAQLLQVDHVGVKDDFFELGGHSLLAMQVVARIRSSLAIELPMRLLFEFPTVRQLAAQLDELRQARVLDAIAAGEDDTKELLARVAAMSESRAQELVRELRVRS